jgi:hypothetical protein
MNLSDFDVVHTHTVKLRNLEAAREAVRYNKLTVLVNRSGNLDIAELPSISDCRRVLGDLLDQCIAGEKAALKTYRVDTDA